MNWNPDLSSHIMECSNTAALQQHEASQDMSREEEAAQLANDAERIRVRAIEIAGSNLNAFDAISELPDTYFQAIGEFSIDESEGVEHIGTQAAVGRKILRAIRDAAIKQARKELGL